MDFGAFVQDLLANVVQALTLLKWSKLWVRLTWGINSGKLGRQVEPSSRVVSAEPIQISCRVTIDSIAGAVDCPGDLCCL